MVNPIRIVGIHPISASEPCHLVEVELDAPSDEFDFGMVTQAIPGQPKDDWQVAYDEQQIDKNNIGSRWVFFFHSLNFQYPLATPLGPISLPQPTPLPSHLSEIEYEAP